MGIENISCSKCFFFRVVLVFLLSYLFIINTVVSANSIIGHREEDAVSIYDEDGNYVFGTTMGVSKGDKYINEDNIEYVIMSINEQRGIAKKIGEVDLLAGIAGELSALIPIAAQENKKIGLYHTHNGESYLPGPANVEGQGDIHEIGDVLKKALEEKGINVEKLNNIHLPHDGAAYERSRNTATDLISKGPDAIFDIHRDAIPRKEEYLTEIDGETISQIRLVVGRQNPNQEVNAQFAKSLKAITDKHHPGLIKGIFYGRGNYNQHLAPHSLLLEIGTHVTTKEQAAASTHMLADSINELLYGSGEVQTRGTEAENRSIVSTIVWILGLTIIGILIFLFINEGSIDGVMSRIKNFFKREFR